MFIKEFRPYQCWLQKWKLLILKKQLATIFFTCEEGKKLLHQLMKRCSTGEAKKIIVKSSGKDKGDDLVAEFLFTWSFKAKSGIRGSYEISARFVFSTFN